MNQTDSTQTLISYDQSEMLAMKLSYYHHGKNIRANNCLNTNQSLYSSQKSIMFGTELYDSNTIYNSDFIEPTTYPNNEVVLLLDNKPIQHGYSNDFISRACPMVYSKISQLACQNKSKGNNQLLINLPKWSNESKLMEYFSFINCYDKKNVKEYDYINLLQYSTLFCNDVISNELVLNQITPRLTINNGLIYLQEAFDYLAKNGENHQSWFKLFLICLEYVSVNMITYISTFRENLLQTNKDLIDELLLTVIKSQRGFIYRDIFIGFIIQLTKCKSNNLLNSIISEQLRCGSKDIINEIVNTSFPIVSQAIQSVNYYSEIPVKTSEKIVLSIIISYKESDDILNINMKIKQMTQYPIASFIIISTFENDASKNQVVIQTFLENTSDNINIFRQSQFSTVSNKKIQIYFRINHIHSILLTYLLNNFDKYYKDNIIAKLSCGLIKQILAISQNNEISNDYRIIALMNWMSDEVNIHYENLKEMFGYIQFGKVSIENIISFIMKYYQVINREDMDDYFLQLFNSRNELKLIGNVLLMTAKKLCYVDKISENFLMKKKITSINNHKDSIDDLTPINKSKIDNFMLGFENDDYIQTDKTFKNSKIKENICFFPGDISYKRIKNLQKKGRSREPLISKYTITSSDSFNLSPLNKQLYKPTSRNTIYEEILVMSSKGANSSKNKSNHNLTQANFHKNTHNCSVNSSNLDINISKSKPIKTNESKTSIAAHSEKSNSYRTKSTQDKKQAPCPKNKNNIGEISHISSNRSHYSTSCGISYINSTKKCNDNLNISGIKKKINKSSINFK